MHMNKLCNILSISLELAVVTNEPAQRQQHIHQ